MKENTSSTTTKFPFNPTEEYKIRKTTYLVTSHFKETADPLKTKVTRLLKQSIKTSCGEV